MSEAVFHVGDSLTVLRTLPDASVDLVLTSSPFLALRAYLPADHPDKALEMGSEPTPGEFIDALLTVIEECRRVLAPHGSIAFELGDTYAGSGGAGGDYGEGGLRDGQPLFRQGYVRNDRPGRVPQESPKSAGKPTTVSGRQGTRSDGNGMVFRGGERQADHKGPGWPLDKSLALVPELLRFALAYGFNPLTGRTTPRWRVRNVVRWCRPNPPVGALGDKVRPATSDIVIACVERKRYFDLDSVRGPVSANTHARTARGVESRPTTGKAADDERRGGNFSTLATLHETNGAPPLDHWWHDDKDEFDQDAWDIPTAPYKGAHYATWPPALLVKPILAMCPQRVCRTCGHPSERIVDVSYIPHGSKVSEPKGVRGGAGASGEHAQHMANGRADKASITTGWTDCGHGDWRNGVVLDPFAGSGTTLAVATGHGRDAIGIDLDQRNADLARDRVGMWLSVVDHQATTEPTPA